MLHRVALSCACVCLGAQAMVPVDVEVRATWDTTPLVLEAAEFVANTSAPLFWTFIERVQSDAATDITTDQDEYTHVLDHAAALLGNETLPLLKLSLAIREFSPAVELFNSKAKQTLQHIHQTLSTETGQCTAFAVTDERIFCAAEELTSHLNEHTPQTKTETVYEFDHLFVPLLGNTNTQVNVVLYGRVRDVKFGALYNTLKNTATERTDFNFAVRHYIADQSEMERLAVSGFGVEMAVKNTEYIATDDRGHQKAAIELNKNTQGNVIELQTATEDEIKDLSLQAAQLIAQTQPHHALHTMTDLAHNFPIRIDFVKNVQVVYCACVFNGCVCMSGDACVCIFASVGCA